VLDRTGANRGGRRREDDEQAMMRGDGDVVSGVAEQARGGS